MYKTTDGISLELPEEFKEIKAIEHARIEKIMALPFFPKERLDRGPLFFGSAFLQFPECIFRLVLHPSHKVSFRIVLASPKSDSIPSSFSWFEIVSSIKLLRIACLLSLES